MKNFKERIEKTIETKWFHIALILIGIIFILLGTFHTGVWFDEAYTMALVRHNYSEIISIDSRDVHPVLYYLLLKTVTLIFGNSILVCRLFSVLAGVLIGVLGYTHIRKDFGPKVGLAFTFLSFFLPFMAMFSMEIRMYTWTMLFVTLSGIYAYRITKKYQIKNWILFAVSSLAAAHCHYYGLAAVAIINGLLFLHILFSKKMYKTDNNEENNTNTKNEKTSDKKLKKKYLISFGITALVQILGYLPWLFVFLTQAQSVSQGYWITLNLADTIAAPLGVQFNGRLGITTTIIFTIIMYIYLIYQIICAKKQKKSVGIIGYCLLVHFILYITMLTVTILIKPIMYYRYMLVTTGILIFPFAYFLGNNSKKHQKIISTLIIGMVLILGVYNNSIIIKENYDKANGIEIKYIKEQYQENDIIIYKEFFQGTNIFVQIPEYNWYLYNIDSKHDIKPFENFSPPLNIIFEEEFIENYKGRIILIDNNELDLYNNLKQKYKLEELELQRFITYRGFIYNVVIVKK